MSSAPEDDCSPFESPKKSVAEIGRVPRVRWSTQTILVASIYLTYAVSSASEVFYFENAKLYFASSVVVALMGTIWATNDARAQSYLFHPVLRMLHLFFCPLSLVLYLVFTRGVRGLAIAALHAVGIIALSSASFYGVYYAIYYTGWWSLYDPVFFSP